MKKQKSNLELSKRNLIILAVAGGLVGGMIVTTSIQETVFTLKQQIKKEIIIELMLMMRGQPAPIRMNRENLYEASL